MRCACNCVNVCGLLLDNDSWDTRHSWIRNARSVRILGHFDIGHYAVFIYGHNYFDGPLATDFAVADARIDARVRLRRPLHSVQPSLGYSVQHGHHDGIGSLRCACNCVDVRGLLLDDDSGNIRHGRIRNARSVRVLGHSDIGHYAVFIYGHNYFDGPLATDFAVADARIDARVRLRRPLHSVQPSLGYSVQHGHHDGIGSLRCACNCVDVRGLLLDDDSGNIRHGRIRNARSVRVLGHFDVGYYAVFIYGHNHFDGTIATDFTVADACIDARTRLCRPLHSVQPCLGHSIQHSHHDSIGSLRCACNCVNVCGLLLDNDSWDTRHSWIRNARSVRVFDHFDVGHYAVFIQRDSHFDGTFTTDCTVADAHVDTRVHARSTAKR